MPPTLGMPGYRPENSDLAGASAAPRRTSSNPSEQSTASAKPASKRPGATGEPKTPAKLRKTASGFAETPPEDRLGRESDEHLVQFSQEAAAGSWPVRLPSTPPPPLPQPQPSPAEPRTPSLLELLRLEDMLVPLPPSPNIVEDFETLLDASRVVRHLKPGGAGCGAGVEVSRTSLSARGWRRRARC